MSDELYRKFTIARTQQWMNDAIGSIERMTVELKRHRDLFVEVTSPGAEPNDLATPVNVLGWFVNSLSQVSSNTRIDLVARYASELALATKED
jgi:hypothetical protein